MGGETSMPESPPFPSSSHTQLAQHQEVSQIEREDFFLLQPLNNIRLAPIRQWAYYLITPDHSHFPQEILPQLRQHFGRVEQFAQVRTFRQQLAFFGQDELVKVIVPRGFPEGEMEFLQREQRVYQIVLVGQGEPPIPLRKIRPVLSWEFLLAFLRDLQSRDPREVSNSTVLLVDEDTKLLNKYRLNFHCATRFHSRKQAKQDFITLARHLYPEQADQISRFERQYDLSLNGEARATMALQWAFANNFYWKVMEHVTRNTTDPKRIAYVRLAMKDLHEAVTHQWRTTPHRQIIYIVVDISQEEKKKLAKSEGKFVLFTSFIKGYTAEYERVAKAQIKNRPNSFIFVVVPNKRPIEPSLDFGLAVGPHDPNDPSRPNVILNIYNVLQVQAMAVNNRNGELLLSALGVSFMQRKENRMVMSQSEINLVRNYDYLQDMMGKIDSQATLLQIAGYTEESLQIYDRKAAALKKSSRGGRSEQQAVERCYILKGDALRRSGNFQSAEKQYLSVVEQRMKLISRVHLAQLYLHCGEQAKFISVVGELEKLNRAQELFGDRDEYFKCEILRAVKKIKQGQFVEAESILRKINEDILTIAEESLEGRPIIHDSYRCLATCRAKLGDSKGALALLKDTLNWQLSCQGKTPNVALTETLIQSVSKSTNSCHQQLQLSVGRMKQMQEQIANQKYRNRNAGYLAIGNDLLRSLRGGSNSFPIINAENSENNAEQFSTKSTERRQNMQGNNINVSKVHINIEESFLKGKTS